MAAPVNIELEAAKFLHKLIQNTKDEPARVAKKLNVILHHMRSSGKENSMPFEVISRALEALIRQHDLRDLSFNSASQVPLSSGMDEAATKIKQPKNISLPDVGYDMTTESLPKEQLAEPQDETYTLQRIPDLDMDLIWEALMVEDCNASKNKEKENSSIYVINKTCTEETSEGKKPEKGISYESSEHFGKPLADAAESFHVSFSDVAVDEPVEESPFADVGSAMNTVSQSSNSETKKSLSRQEIIDIEDDPLVSDHSCELLIVKDATHN